MISSARAVFGVCLGWLLNRVAIVEGLRHSDVMYQLHLLHRPIILLTNHPPPRSDNETGILGRWSMGPRMRTWWPVNRGGATKMLMDGRWMDGKEMKANMAMLAGRISSEWRTCPGNNDGNWRRRRREHDSNEETIIDQELREVSIVTASDAELMKGLRNVRSRSKFLDFHAHSLWSGWTPWSCRRGSWPNGGRRAWNRRAWRSDFGMRGSCSRRREATRPKSCNLNSWTSARGLTRQGSSYRRKRRICRKKEEEARELEACIEGLRMGMERTRARITRAEERAAYLSLQVGTLGQSQQEVEMAHGAISQAMEMAAGASPELCNRLGYVAAYLHRIAPMLLPASLDPMVVGFADARSNECSDTDLEADDFDECDDCAEGDQGGKWGGR